MRETLLIGREHMVQYIDIPATVKDDSLFPCILQAQQIDLRQWMGNIFYNDFVINVKEDKYKKLLNGDEYTDINGIDIIYSGLAPALSYYAYSRWLINSANSNTSIGLVKKSMDWSERTPLNEIKWLSAQNIEMANTYISQAKEYIIDNIQHYPLSTLGSDGVSKGIVYKTIGKKNKFY